MPYCRIDVFTGMNPPHGPIDEGVEFHELDAVPTPGMTLIFKEEGKADRVYGVIITNLTVTTDGKQIWGIGCRSNQHKVVAAPAGLILGGKH